MSEKAGLDWHQPYLDHDTADVIDTLCDGVGGAGDRDGPLRGVRQHLTRHLDGRAGNLESERGWCFNTLANKVT